MVRGITAVRVYLQAQFPGYVVEVLLPSSRDAEHDICSFRVQKDGERYLLRVSDELLDLDTEGVLYHLEKYGVVQALRGVDSGRALLVVIEGIPGEPISR